MINKIGGVLPKLLGTENDIANKASGADFASFIKEASKSSVETLKDGAVSYTHLTLPTTLQV